ncbi:MAG: hypothetical protein JWL68_994, partial [Actinomycetia bacterium]|nr:hypothetical protein [Actinomycetes bacterium]
ILISKPFHTRSAEPLWGRYRRAKARIYGHPEVATRLGDASGFEAVTSGHDVGGVARFHAIGRPPRSEQPVRDHGPGGRGTSLKDPGPHCRGRFFMRLLSRARRR